MRISKALPFFSVTTLIIAAASSARGDVLAADNAGNYVGTGWVDGSNAGTGTPGFTSPWNISYTPSTAYVGLSTSGPVNWELDANDDGTSSASADRYFPAIGSGDYITLDLNADNVASDGFAGVYFLDQSGFPEFQIYVQPSVALSNGFSSEDYLIEDAAPGGGTEVLDTGIVANGDTVSLTLKLLDATAHTYTATVQQAGSPTFTTVDPSGLFTYAPTSQIDHVYFADQSSGTPFYLNNLTVVPLPPSAMAAAPLLAILAMRKLHRR